MLLYPKDIGPSQLLSPPHSPFFYLCCHVPSPSPLVLHLELCSGNQRFSLKTSSENTLKSNGLVFICISFPWRLHSSNTVKRWFVATSLNHNEKCLPYTVTRRGTQTIWNLCDASLMSKSKGMEGKKRKKTQKHQCTSYKCNRFELMMQVGRWGAFTRLF